MKEFSNDGYRKFIYTRTYSRWDDELGRRETWEESVQRYMDYMRKKLGVKLSDGEYSDIQNAIVKQEVMPSMRLLWSAGRAVEKTNVTAYNCSYVSIRQLQDFGEVLYLLTCGAGVGFSCEKHSIDSLPQVEVQTGEKLPTHIVDDSREGWADALVLGLKTWFSGKDIDFDYSQIRPEGSRLKTMGGRASGFKPLKGLLSFTKEKVLSKQGEKLRPIDVHDIVCKIGDVVLMGGVRRSSEISLSDLDDYEMRNAKQGTFYINEPQRSMANNSVAYKEKPTQQQFMEEWLALMKSGSGERGIFNRAGLVSQMPKRRWENTEEHYEFMGTNPCGEITLRSKQFCNLTEIVAREDDTIMTLLEKCRIATILGTYQSSLTDFQYLSPEWKKNCEEEALLGVSITGQFDCPAVRNEESLQIIRDYAVQTNQEYAKKFGINPSASITCVKPSGTVSQLVNASSGMHPRYAKYYIRRVRISATDPLFRMMKTQGVKYLPEVGQKEPNVTTYVLEFPIKAPDNAVTRHDVTAIQQLEYWKMVKNNYTEHNPSCTVYVGENEWLKVADWLWDNWDQIGGLSFLPKDTHVYELAPYQEITEEEYNLLASTFPDLDFSELTKYEIEDQTEGAKELACVGGACDIVDYTNQQPEKELARLPVL